MAIFGRNPELEAKVILDLRETLKNIRDATEGAKTFDEQVAALKKAIVEFSRVSNQSFEKTAKEMKKLGEDLFAVRTELPFTEAIRQLQKEAQDPTGLERFRRILERVEESQQRLIQISQELANAFRTSFNVAIASGTNLRQRVDALKEEMRAFQQVTGESLQFTSQAFRDTAKSTEAFTVADVNQAFRELREEAREAEQQLKATFIGAQPPTQVLRTNVDAVKQAILALKDSSGESLQFATTAFRQLNAQTGQFDAATIAQAFRELQGEAKTLDEQLRKTFIESPVQYTTNFRTNVDLIKQQIETLRQSGITSIGDLEQGFRRFAQITQAFSLSEVTQAFKEVREALKLEDSQKGLKDAGQEADRFRQNVNQIKAEMIALGEGGRRSLKDVEEGFRRANETSQRFNPREITQAVREIGEQA